MDSSLAWHNQQCLADQSIHHAEFMHRHNKKNMPDCQIQSFGRAAGPLERRIQGPIDMNSIDVKLPLPTLDQETVGAYRAPETLRVGHNVDRASWAKDPFHHWRDQASASNDLKATSESEHLEHCASEPEVSTSLTAPVLAGALTLPVASQDGFRAGDTIMIGDEINKVRGFGSILLGYPLAKFHPVGTVVRVLDVRDMGMVPPEPVASFPAPWASPRSLGDVVRDHRDNAVAAAQRAGSPVATSFRSPRPELTPSPAPPASSRAISERSAVFSVSLGSGRAVAATGSRAAGSLAGSKQSLRNSLASMGAGSARGMVAPGTSRDIATAKEPKEAVADVVATEGFDAEGTLPRRDEDTDDAAPNIANSVRSSRNPSTVGGWNASPRPSLPPSATSAISAHQDGDLGAQRALEQLANRHSNLESKMEQCHAEQQDLRGALDAQRLRNQRLQRSSPPHSAIGSTGADSVPDRLSLASARQADSVAGRLSLASARQADSVAGRLSLASARQADSVADRLSLASARQSDNARPPPVLQELSEWHGWHGQLESRMKQCHAEQRDLRSALDAQRLRNHRLEKDLAEAVARPCQDRNLTQLAAGYSRLRVTQEERLVDLHTQWCKMHGQELADFEREISAREIALQQRGALGEAKVQAATAEASPLVAQHLSQLNEYRRQAALYAEEIRGATSVADALRRELYGGDAPVAAEPFASAGVSRTIAHHTSGNVRSVSPVGTSRNLAPPSPVGTSRNLAPPFIRPTLPLVRATLPQLSSIQQHVSYSHARAAASVQAAAGLQGHPKSLFDMLDSKSKGQITREEFRKSYASLHGAPPRPPRSEAFVAGSSPDDVNSRSVESVELVRL